ncbi:hypothetical protein [Azospirillum argentinense]|nr:hypothetical protein [Azospirillum argentinense]
MRALLPIHRPLATAVAFLMLAGCNVPQANDPNTVVALRWERPNSSQTDFQADVARCDYEVSAVVPPAQYHPFATNVWVLLQDQINISDAESRMRALMEKCLLAHDWQKVALFANARTSHPQALEFKPRQLQ